MTVIDLSNCDLEPIHIPGKVQSHGFLLAVNHDLKIMYCSENIVEFTQVPAIGLLGVPVHLLETTILKKAPGFIRGLLDIAHTNEGFKPVNPYPVMINRKDFNLILCESADQYLLEFEPATSDLNFDLQQVIGSSLSAILANASLNLLLDRTAQQIRKIIGYDRVMVYKFHDDGHGEVVAEAKNDVLFPWIGLHYPASDIPKQARELYKLNLVRLIADVASTPSGLLTYAALNETPLDLTQSSLRAVSPVHIQYLKNMWVASSFSVSLIHQGELWGLVACHNYTPRYIHYKQREAAKLIGQALSSALSFRQMEEDQHKNNRLKAAVDELTRHLQRHDSIEGALFDHETTLLQAVEATGAVLAYDNQFYRSGATPDDKFIAGLIAWLQENMQESVYSTNKLPEEYAPALKKRAKASGILVCRLSRELKEYMIWFRPEVITNVKWAGNPAKPVEITETGLANISPRRSFETWVQTVKHTAQPWATEDLRSALHLKDEVAFAISRKATEIRQLNDKLKEAYDELDAFSYTISHDLKNPLTTIKSYSQLLKRSLQLPPREQTMLENILAGANKMQGMIEEVLHYSKAGQVMAEPVKVDMTALLAYLKEQLLVSNEHLPLQITIGKTPPLFGDATMIQQVFSNLVGNAVKYSSQSSAPAVSIHGDISGKQVRYRVTDNGIGIKLKDLEKIFDLFSRSDDAKGFEGSGVGLAIVKKIMEKHQGRIWVESEPNVGATFHVSFPVK